MTSTVWWVSDTHFSHKNIIQYCNRPFTSPAEMNQAMTDAWNERVRPQDTVWHLGDFSFERDPDRLAQQLKALNGKKHLIAGNHDGAACRRLADWESVRPYAEIRVDGKFMVLCHYAMRVWNKSHHGSWMLYGHSHATLPGNSQSLDVGVDCWDYAPVAFEAIRDRLATLPRYEGYGEQAGGGDHHGVAL